MPHLLAEGGRRTLSSQADDGFQQILQHYDYAASRTLTAEQLARLFEYMHPLERGLITDLEELQTKDYLPEAGRSAARLPAVANQPDGTTMFTFWTIGSEPDVTMSEIVIQPDDSTTFADTQVFD